MSVSKAGRQGDEAGGMGAKAEHWLTLGGYVVSSVDAGAERRRGVTLPVSILLHTAAAAAIVVVPLLVAEAIPEPNAGVRAFLVEPMTAPVPPPPPPPRPATAARVAPKAPQEAPSFVAPVEVPTEITPEAALDLGGVEAGSRTASRAAFRVGWSAASSAACPTLPRPSCPGAWAGASASRAGWWWSRPSIQRSPSRPASRGR